MAYIKWILFSVFVNVYLCDAYKILLVFPLASRSHGILGDSMAKHLLKAGHEVTYITPYNRTEPHPRLTIVDVSAVIEFFSLTIADIRYWNYIQYSYYNINTGCNRSAPEDFKGGQAEDALNVKHIMDKTMNFRDPDKLTHLLIDVATTALENKNLQKFIRDPKQNFDVVVSEWMFSELYSVFAPLFDCPLIWLSTVEPHWIISELIDGPLNPAYSGDYLNDHVPPFSFIERIQELWVQVNGIIRKNFIYYYKEEEVYQRLIVPILKEKGKAVPSYQAVRRNASLVLGNSQAAIGDAVSLPQSYKHVGGYHIDEPVKALPEDLKKLMDNSKDGVIYFSMGTNLKSKDLPTELKRNILNMFGTLKQTVIWKFEEILPNLPKNVHILQWAPQQSILAHPNTVLFITHGGLLSITETIHFGVPIITIPVFADQFLNSVRADKRGFGKKVDLSYKMNKDIKAAIDEVLSNPKYSAKVKELSQIYHDRAMKPREELVYWISHVIRTHGAQHLRSPALQLHLYQRIYLDLIAILLVSIYILKLILKYLISMVASKCNKKEKRL